MSDATNPRLELLIDSNLLLLLTVGSFDLQLLKNFKRLSGFGFEDFYVLRDFAKPYQVFATPHIFTEVTNLANSLPSKIREPFFLYFAKIIQSTTEILYTSDGLSRTFEYQIFGLTDGAIYAAPKSILILTEDGRLRDYMHRQGRAVIGLQDVKLAREQLNKKYD